MPSIAAHMVCAKLISKKLNIDDPEFIKGNLLPDIIAREDSHRKVLGKYYYIPDIEYFVKKLDLNDNLNLGYLCHLLLDKYFLEDYIYDVVNGEEVFSNGIIYKEYDSIHCDLIKRFGLDIQYLNKILKDFKYSIEKKKYLSNMKCLNNVERQENLKYLDIDSFVNFLIEVSENIVKYLKGVKDDECKSSLSSHYT